MQIDIIIDLFTLSYKTAIIMQYIALLLRGDLARNSIKRGVQE